MPVKKSLAIQADPEKLQVSQPAVNVKALLKAAPKGAFNKNLKPMLATLVDSPFDDDGWNYEIKWDGYRALAFMESKEAELKSRNNISFNEKFFPVLEAIKSWDLNAIVDGEIVVADEQGISNFGLLQNWRSEADGELLFYVFDILWLDGKDLTGLTQKERSGILSPLIPKEGIIRAGFSVEGRGSEFFDVARQMGMEGIIAKRSDSIYIPGARSKDWLKIKVKKRQEVIITGYTKNENSPKKFSSLLLAAYLDGQLHYVGKVGTGFSDRQQKEMLAQFKPLVTEKSPFKEIPEYNKASRFRPDPPHAKVTWLKPRLVCEVNYADITQDGVFRHPSFVAMREDKDAKDVVIENSSTVPLVEK